ncbi:TIR domain-containing protein [Tautonia plasticadhaerens]|uniref:DNA-binding transcriptional dual regulator Crp n=1 Tax=Tautonia plasticadhaerens TaxID=2527974 RepID=A0A518HEJ5_9BACT|nr:TIR domain-containing protein [Tautonia plasticadhaerens]QDV39272.1 DNA-binding transcriptional dual regulator Crp [Tautonia plasticadhaerens]
MKNRFEGDEGRRRLIEALKGNALVEHDAGLATRLAEVGEVIEYGVQDRIIEQGAGDDDLYIILCGEVDILVNSRWVASRGPRDYVGEMVMLDASAVRSATVVARTQVAALRVNEPEFHRIAEQYPRVWRPIARTLAERLRQRAQFHRTPNPEPVLFLGSSREGLVIAEEIKLGLKNAPINVIGWTDDVFGPSSVSIDALLMMVKEADFAGLVFGPDDKVVSRRRQSDTPRDNVVFELGLFMGGLGRERTFIIKDRDTNLKIPTDLLGVTPITYVEHDPARIASTVGTVCTELRKTILSMGVR